MKLPTGREATRFRLYSYIDARDAARAFRLAVEKPGIPAGTVLFIVADDTAVAEPLCDLLPRLMPLIGDKASALTGATPAISNASAKQVLGWEPRWSWR